MSDLFQVVEAVEFDERELRCAFSKPRFDITSVLDAMGAQQISVCSEGEESRNGEVLSKLSAHARVSGDWARALQSLQASDVIIIQFPVMHHTLLFDRVMRGLKRRGVRVVLLLHDLELLRHGLNKSLPTVQRLRIRQENGRPLELADALVTHNKDMTEALEALLGKSIRDRCIEIKIFDYLVSIDASNKVRHVSDPVVVAGNLMPEKAGYISQLPKNQKFALYGIGYDADSKPANIDYFGSFPPDELPSVLHGSFGLVWDGPSSNTCTGTWGDYLRANNPHKTSLYIASGLPIIVWNKAAIAKFVLENNVGITVSSLDEIPGRIASIDGMRYQAMCSSAVTLARKLHEGYFTKAAVEAALALIKQQDCS